MALILVGIGVWAVMFCGGLEKKSLLLVFAMMPVAVGCFAAGVCVVTDPYEHPCQSKKARPRVP